MRAAIILSLLLAASCVSAEGPDHSGNVFSVTPIAQPDGRTAWLIGCYGAFHSMKACYQRARWLCNFRSYEVLGQDWEALVVDPAPPGVIRGQLYIMCSKDRPSSKKAA